MEALIRICQREGVKAEYPIALVGKPARELLSTTELPIRRAHSKEELDDIIAQYHMVPKTATPLVIEDLSYVPTHSLPKLLKFLEESKLQIVLLATYDVLTPTILSRLRTVIKGPLTETKTNLLRPSVGRERLGLSPDTHPLDKYRRWGQESPQIYVNEKTIPVRPNRNKLLQLIE